MVKFRNIRLLGLVMALLLTACEGSFTPDETGVLTGITLLAPKSSEVCDVFAEAPDQKWVVPFSWTIQGEYLGSYRIVATERNGGSSLVEGETANTSISLELERAKFYSWRVEAIDQPDVDSGQNDFVTPASIATASSPPILSDIMVSSDGDDKYRIAYEAVDAEGDNVLFDVYVATVDQFTTPNFNDIPENEVTVTMAAGTTYFIRVEATDGTGTTTANRSYTTPQ